MRLEAKIVDSKDITENAAFSFPSKLRNKPLPIQAQLSRAGKTMNFGEACL